jgi:hypothetical protein
MIGRMSYSAAAAALVTATALLAQAPLSADSRGDANKQICRTFADTGTRLGRYRACHTAQEWIELRRQTKQNVDHIQNSRAWRAEG